MKRVGFYLKEVPNYVWIMILLGFFLGILFLVVYLESRPNITCSSFSSQKEAQEKFDSDRNFFYFLDRDQDNIPCESL